MLRLAVIGDPVSHSLSPRIHTAALAHLGLEGSYTARRVGAAELGAILAEVARGDLDGINVTMPHKQTVASLVDRLTDDARAAGSVNTVTRDTDGTLVGHSTDVSALRRTWPTGDGHPTLVLGAGGAAAAACRAAPVGALYLAARRPEAVSELEHRLGRELIALRWGTAVVEATVVNATPLGMRGETLPPRVVALAGALIDLAYGSEPTPAVREAAACGIPVVDGIRFLTEQAADSFRLWTGREAPVEIMLKAARNSLKAEPGGSDS